MALGAPLAPGRMFFDVEEVHEALVVLLGGEVGGGWRGVAGIAGIGRRAGVIWLARRRALANGAKRKWARQFLRMRRLGATREVTGC